MTQIDRALKTGRKLTRNASSASHTALSGGEMLSAAGDVIAARMRIMADGMTDPAKVLGFLDVAGAWDPSLALVMGGAIAVAAPGQMPAAPTVPAGGAP